MRVFFDTSALAKRYVVEEGSNKVMAVCDRADTLAISVICLPELISTLSRLVREKKISPAQYRATRGAILTDLAGVDICEMTPQVMDSVIELLEQHHLRAMDAIHVACALAYQPDLFVSADKRQAEAARKSGIKVLLI